MGCGNAKREMPGKQRLPCWNGFHSEPVAFQDGVVQHKLVVVVLDDRARVQVAGGNGYVVFR